MAFDVEGSSVLYGLGVLLGIASVIYFGQEILLSLSPVSKAVLLFLGFVAFLLIGNAVHRDVLDTVLYVLAAGTYTVFLGYTVLRFDLSTNQVFLLLAASSTLFIGLGYVVRENRIQVSERHVRMGLALTAALALLLVVFDVTGPQAVTSTETSDTVNLSEQEVMVGAVTVQNGFLFSRTVDMPRYTACLYVPGEDEKIVAPAVRVGEGYSSTRRIPGKATRTYNVSIRFPTAPPEYEDRGLTVEDYRDLGLVPVELAEQCPGDVETTVVVLATSPSRPDYADARKGT